MKFLLRLLCLASLVCLLAPVAGAMSPKAPLHIYLDADMTGARAAGVAIERGIRTALAENGNRLDGRPVEVVVLNHRGNSARSLSNLKKFLADPEALVLFCGLHSPPLLAHRQFINDNHILVLDPWAAAGPITRPSDENNWIFRLSVDDSKAGEAIVRRAVDGRKFKKPALLLENTGWGKSNLRTMTASLKERGMAPSLVTWFDWGLSESAAKIMLRDCIDAGADAVFLVGNAPEGKAVCKAMHALPVASRIPIISHWGITGGDFPQVVTPALRAGLDLEFIQTRFSFLDMEDNTGAQAVFSRAMELFPEVRKPADVTAPTGFVHAYDLTRILLVAVSQAKLSGDMKKDRAAIRHALENLKGKVPGLIKTYDRPFRPYTVENKDAHEALAIEDFTFGTYGEGNEIILVR